MEREVLENMSSAELVKLLKEDPSLSSKFDEYSLWSKIITWSLLLEVQPQFAGKCDKWDEFDAYDWHILLEKHPQFADKCDEYGGWSKFDAGRWRYLLAEQPQFADKAKEFASGWAGILRTKPELANKCDKWSVTLTIGTHS